MNIVVIILAVLLLGLRGNLNNGGASGIPPIVGPGEGGTGGRGCNNERQMAMQIARGKLIEKYPGVSYDDLPNTLAVWAYKWEFRNCDGVRDFPASFGPDDPFSWL